MADCDNLTALLRELCALATQARQRGDRARADDLPPQYWYGVQVGYEDSIVRLETILHEH